MSAKDDRDGASSVDVLNEQLLARFQLELTERYSEAPPGQTCSIDVRAPFELVEAMVDIRNALVRSPFGCLDTCCWEATGALGLRARQLGYPAEWQPANYGGAFHMLLASGRWLFDPTAEQFGASGPQVFHLSSWREFVDELNPGSETEMLGGVPDVEPLSDASLVGRLVRWVEEDKGSRPRLWKTPPRTAIPSLLSAAHLQHLKELVTKGVNPQRPPKRPFK